LVVKIVRWFPSVSASRPVDDGKGESMVDDVDEEDRS